MLKSSPETCSRTITSYSSIVGQEKRVQIKCRCSDNLDIAMEDSENSNTLLSEDRMSVIFSTCSAKSIFQREDWAYGVLKPCKTVSVTTLTTEHSVTGYCEIRKILHFYINYPYP